jgi:hypothetical protein
LRKILAYVPCEFYGDSQHSPQNSIQRLAINIAIEVAQNPFDVIAKKRERRKVPQAVFWALEISVEPILIGDYGIEGVQLRRENCLPN